MTDKQTSAASHDASAPARRKAWSAPHLARLRAGQAEIGANPAKPELNFAYGS
jgi:hypothetical protein